MSVLAKKDKDALEDTTSTLTLLYCTHNPINQLLPKGVERGHDTDGEQLRNYQGCFDGCDAARGDEHYMGVSIYTFLLGCKRPLHDVER